MGKIFATAFLIVCCAACQRPPDPTADSADRSKPPLPAGFSEADYRAAALAMGAGECTDLLKIKAAPHKLGVLGADPYWDRIVVYAQHYRPCLVEAVGDRSPVRGISFGPSNPAHTVGDVAHALLVEAGFIPWGVCVPSAVSGDPRGAVAVRDWLGQSGNRTAWETCLKRELGPN